MIRLTSKPEMNTKNASTFSSIDAIVAPFQIWISEDFQLNVKYPLIQLIYNTL